MRIYKRDEFLTLPEGTVFSQGGEWNFNGIEIKQSGADYTLDFVSFDPCWIDSEDSNQAFDRLEEMLGNGASYPMDTASGRDGMFDKNVLFLVFEKDDLISLREYIDNAIKLG